MVKRWFAIVVTLLLASFLVVGCGIPQEEHDAVLAELAAAESGIVTLETELAESEAEVVALQSNTSTLEGTVSTLEGTVSTLEADLAASEAEVSTLEAELAPIIFPDAGLGGAIRTQLNQARGPINKSHLEGLTYLLGSERGIQDITVLELCVNLFILNLWDNNISDISALAALTNLTGLDLWLNNISDISPLADLIYIEYLDLGYNNISDISALVENNGLSAGDTVYLSGNPLNTTSINEYIPQLEARGVIVFY